MSTKLTIIIADDEHNVREGLKEIVPWDEMGIEIAAVASDGQEAFELCLELNPDILLTDIRMPMMDGLEAAMKLKERHRPVRVVIISGAQDFNYVKTALHLHADGYILKPIKIHELQETIEQVAASIRAERERHAHTDQLKQQLQENIPTIREKFLSDLVQGLYRSEREVRDKLSLFELPLDMNGVCTVAVFQIDEYEKALERYSADYKQLLSFSVTNILDEVASRERAGVAFAVGENGTAVVFNQSAVRDNRHIALCEEMIACINRFLKLSISAGVGNPVQQIARLHASFNEANAALEYRFFKGKNAILPIGDFRKQGAEPEFPQLYEEQKRLIDAMKEGKPDEVADRVRRIFDSVCSGSQYPVGYVQSVCFDLINMASKTLYELGEKIENVISGYSEMFGEMYNKREAAQLQDMALALFVKLADYFSLKHNQKNSHLIGKIKDIVARRYMENLSVSRLAEEVYLSPNYISLIFKQETGENLTEHITKVRMEAAKTLLRDNDLKVLEVAEMVGFENTTYFSTVFKKYTGLHPQKYRSLFHE